MRNGATIGRFAVRGLVGAVNAEVLGENRKLEVRDGKFNDTFQPYDVHLYRIR
jgi:hypothetical protein